MSDVVERLRHTAEHGIFDACEKGMLPDFDEAADEIERLREALALFVNCSYPVATEINRRGYNWSEAYLDGALPIAKAALKGNQ